MNNNAEPSSWKKAFKTNFENKYINLILYSYGEMLKTPLHKELKDKKETPWENTRRNMLCEQMRRNKFDFGITFNISTESGVYDNDFRDAGRMDICCYLNELDNQYIAFECKRFLKKEVIPSYIKTEYYGQGIKRFEDNVYSENVNIGGMIAFLEEGDYKKLHKSLEVELRQYSLGSVVEDISSEYVYNYIFKSEHLRTGNKNIMLFHILMDFS